MEHLAAPAGSKWIPALSNDRASGTVTIPQKMHHININIDGNKTIQIVYGCSDCNPSPTKPEPLEYVCDGETINLCDKHAASWKATIIKNNKLRLSDCAERKPKPGEQLLLFVSRGDLDNYGKYEFVTVKSSPKSDCIVTLRHRIKKLRNIGNQCALIAQTFPSFSKVSLRNGCVLTCNGQTGGIGGILAFKARSLSIDDTSKIDMSGKGYLGGNGGTNRGGGGQGGETFGCLTTNMGKGGDINAGWSTNTNGIGGGGAGDGPSSGTGSKGGPGGYNAGGGGADSTVNSDDGAAGGGGGGHFSGGGGGGAGSGCGGNDGGKEGTAGQIGTSAGGGGQSSCPGGNGGNGGNAGNWPPHRAPHCYDKSAEGGNAGTSALGGGGGDSCGGHYGGGGGGGGLQFGSTDFRSRLSYGGGGGGGGGSAFSDDPNPGGKGGNGGGLVYLQLDELTLNGKILAEGQPGQCLSRKAHRSAPGGSGAGGSVVIITKKLNENPNDKISTSGGDPVKCAFGAGGGGGGGVGRWVVQKGKSTLHS